MNGFAQVDSETNPPSELKDDELLKIHALPYYSFGKGVGITSPDSMYQLNIRFRIQNRFTFAENNDGKESLDAEIRRLRLRFDGYVGSPKFVYSLQLSFAPGDVGEVKDGENLNIIRDAVIWYQPNNKWSIGFGQTKIPGNRQRFNSSGALQLTDRSINNANFNIDRDFGLQVHRLNMYKNKFSYNIKTSITQGEGRNFTENDDLGLAYTGKVEIYPFGAFKSNGEYFEGDVKREDRVKLMLSGAYHYNNKAKKAQGQLGDYLYKQIDLHSAFADVVLKYKGFAFMGAYMSRFSDNAVTKNDAGNVKYAYVGQGFDLQSSYINKKNLEFIGRYSLLNVDDQIKAYAPEKRQYTIGLTKYIWEHNFKLQGELTYEDQKFINNVMKHNWYFRFQVEIGI